MNKTMKTFGTILACLALTGTCLAAPRGGRHHHNRGAAPTHHIAHHGHHQPPPPPPPPPEAHHHHHGGHHHTGPVAFGAAVIGGLVEAVIRR